MDTKVHRLLLRLLIRKAGPGHPLPGKPHLIGPAAEGSVLLKSSNTPIAPSRVLQGSSPALLDTPRLLPPEAALYGHLPAEGSQVRARAHPGGRGAAGTGKGVRWAAREARGGGQAGPDGGAGPESPPPPGPPCATPDPACSRLTGRYARLRRAALTSPGRRPPGVSSPRPRRRAIRRLLRYLSPRGGPSPDHGRPRRR